MAAPRGPFYKEFGRKLAQIRREKRITQAGLAVAIGLSRTSIVNIEKGRHAVQLHVAANIARSLDISVIALLPEQNLPPGTLVVSELNKLSPPTRQWVERVISEPLRREESTNETEVFTRKTQSGGASPRGKSKDRTGSR